MSQWHCDCHLKHSSQILDLEKQCTTIKKDMGKIWNAIQDKISLKWLIVLVPLFAIWMSFQAAIYNGVKNLETEVAVIKIQVQAHTDHLRHVAMQEKEK